MRLRALFSGILLIGFSPPSAPAAPSPIGDHLLDDAEDAERAGGEDSDHAGGEQLRRTAPGPTVGTLRGLVVNAKAAPVEYVAVSAKNKADGKTVASTATNRKGAFELEGLPFGNYELLYGLVGAEQRSAAVFTLDARHRVVDLGRLALAVEGVVKLEKVEVSARQEAFYNSIDRKVYNVGKDVQSATGAASDLLNNVPSVKVDIEGNVSLRGDGNVLILINGKSSSMMGRNRAAVLEQMPADSIEKIEVITNPSAQYKPDGTAGIINLTLKKKQEAGFSGSVRGSVGNNGRYNGSVSANYNPGKYNLHGNLAFRRDDRARTVEDDRSHFDPTTNTTVFTSQRTKETQQPISRIAQGGVDYKLDEQTKIGVSANYNYRYFLRHSIVTSQSGSGGALTGDSDRLRRDPEYQDDLELTGKLEHSFAKEGHELTAEIKRSRSTEEENNHYTNIYRTPARVTSFDDIFNDTIETDTEFSIDYNYPIDERSKLAAGYLGERSQFDVDFRGSSFNAATNSWVANAAETNRFIYDSMVHAVYGTYARKMGKFGALAGLRIEQATVDTDQVTTQLTNTNRYARLYPSLHLSYDLTETQQLQLNYSHRVHRPEGEDMNPFPKYQDPFNLRAGNPGLIPEDIHSVETGWQFKKDDTTYLITAYYRYRYHGVTEVSRYIDATTLLTTKENLGTSRSGGLELGATTRLGDRVALNFSGNVYRNEIDASNLGFSTRSATMAWDAKLNLSWDVTKATLVQLNANYTAKRLTPQGYRYPAYFANIGLRHNFKDRRFAAVVSLSDIFDSLRERTHIDTPMLRQEIVRRRSSRTLYIGFIYDFGKPTKKQKDEMQFDTAP